MPCERNDADAAFDGARGHWAASAGGAKDERPRTALCPTS